MLPIDVLISGSSWRCMDGKVYACFVGANLPCMEMGDPTNATSSIWLVGRDGTGGHLLADDAADA